MAPGLARMVLQLTRAAYGALASSRNSISADGLSVSTLPVGLPANRDILDTLAAHNRAEVAGTGHFACLGVFASVVTPGPVAVGDCAVIG